MDPEDLPRRERGARRVDEGFWRAGGQSARVSAAAARKKRRTTLPKQPVRKRLRRPDTATRCGLTPSADNYF